MLTSFQCEVVAYVGDGDLYCPDCAPEAIGEDLEDAGLIRYTVDEEFPGGLWCGECGAEIAEPAEDYCTEHGAWRAYLDGEEQDYCDASFAADDAGLNGTARRIAAEITLSTLTEQGRVDDPCRFPEVEA